MFTGVFKDRSAKEKIARELSRDVAAEQALADLLSSRELCGHALLRNCEIGPFVIAYLFAERSLIVELAPAALAAESPRGSRHDARLKFLGEMGYGILSIAPWELLRHPRRVLARVRTALER
jgi:very-short-patch-repair endonuclease